jgi:hypothetical protein
MFDSQWEAQCGREWGSCTVLPGGHRCQRQVPHPGSDHLCKCGQTHPVSGSPGSATA